MERKLTRHPETRRRLGVAEKALQFGFLRPDPYATDPSGHFSLTEVLVSGAILATLNVLFAPYTANAPGEGDVTYPPLTKDEILFSAGSGFILGAGGNAAGQTLGVAGRFVSKHVVRPFRDLFDGHRPRQGFSGVWEETTSRINMKPSPNERGAPVPEGWVARGGGHETLSLELGGDMASHYGFAVILIEDGTLEVTWVSRTLNPAPRFVVPRELRPQVVRAIEEATGRTVSKPNLD